MQLNECRERVVALKIQGLSGAAIARELGVHENTVQRWLRNDDELRQMLADARETVLQDALDALRATLPLAGDRLRDLLDNRTTGDANTLTAIRTALEFAMKGTSFASLERELQELKAQLSEETP